VSEPAVRRKSPVDVEKQCSDILLAHLRRLLQFRDHVPDVLGAAAKQPSRTGICDQEDLSTKRSPPQEEARVSPSHEHARGPRHLEAQTGEGTHPAVSVNPDPTGSWMRPHQTLRNARDFERVRRQGRRVNRTSMTVYLSPREAAEDPTRVGLAVPLGPGSAVARNRIKRRLRSAAAAAIPRRGWDVLIQARPDLHGMKFQNVASELERAVAGSREGAR
jgi:ribonuclease P protein component